MTYLEKELIIQKQYQAIEILNEKNIDMWLTFVRETGNIKDPMLDIIVGTGGTWHSAFILTKTGRKIAIIGNLEQPNMEMVGTFSEIKSYLKSIKEPLLETLNEISPNKIAINYSQNSSLADGLTYGMFLELNKFLSGTEFTNKFISSEDLVSALRGRKSATEISIMKEAIKETLTIFDSVTHFISPGKTEKDIANFVINQVKEKGFGFAWDEEHCPAVFSGPDTAGAHSGPTNRKIEKGHIINMDFGINLKGYCSDLQRTWYVLKENESDAPKEVKHGFETIKKSIEMAASEIKPGKKGWEIDKIARDYIVSQGYDEYNHGLGHQVGRMAHDGGALLGPQWERYGNLPYIELEKDQVFTIEPRLTVPGYGIATVEVMIQITDEGCEWLSPNQEELYLIKS